MSKVVNNNTETNVTAEQIAEAEELFNVKSKTGEFIDVTDNFDDAVEVANKTPGATVNKDGDEEILYTSPEETVTEPEVVAEPVVEEVKEEPAPVKKEKVAKPQHTKACVQVVAVDDVIKTVEPESKVVKPTKIIMPGTMVKLINQHIYKSAHIPQPFKLMTGNVFIYDAKLINGRYRVVGNVNNCGGDIKNVIGYIPENYIK